MSNVIVSRSRAAPAKADGLLNVLFALSPDFLWLPSSAKTLRLDRAHDVVGVEKNDTRVAFGGVENPVANGSGYLSFPTNLGLGANGTFSAYIFVDIPDPTAVTGCFLKIGGVSGGVGIGGGSTEFDNTGPNLLLLKESVAWVTNGSNAFVKGLNVIHFAYAVDVVTYATNYSTGVSAWQSGGYNAPETGININGYVSGRGSNATVRAVAIYKNSLGQAQQVALADSVLKAFLPLSGMPAVESQRLFIPRDRRTIIDIGAGGGTSYNLSIAEAFHSHSSDPLSLSWQDLLTVADATHAHSVDSIGLSSSLLLAVGETSHAHVADNVGLQFGSQLTVQEASHAHVADSLSLSTQWLLAVHEALHAHAADNLGLSTTGSASLTVQDATHAHVVDALILVTTWLLTVADSAHAHVADSITLDTSNATWLTVQESLHSHASDNAALTLNTWLAIVDAAHAHHADAPTLSAETALVVAETLHAFYSDTLVLSLPGATSLTPEDIQSIAAAVVAALNATTIPANVEKVRGQSLKGSGTEADPWGPA